MSIIVLTKLLYCKVSMIAKLSILPGCLITLAASREGNVSQPEEKESAHTCAV